MVSDPSLQWTYETIHPPCQLGQSHPLMINLLNDHIEWSLESLHWLCFPCVKFYVLLNGTRCVRNTPGVVSQKIQYCKFQTKLHKQVVPLSVGLMTNHHIYEEFLWHLLRLVREKRWTLWQPWQCVCSQFHLTVSGRECHCWAGATRPTWFHEIFFFKLSIPQPLLQAQGSDQWDHNWRYGKH